MEFVLFFFIVLIGGGEFSLIFLRRAYCKKIINESPESILVVRLHRIWLTNKSLWNMGDFIRKGFPACILMSIIIAGISTYTLSFLAICPPKRFLVAVLIAWGFYRLTMLISDWMASKIVIPDHPIRVLKAVKNRITTSLYVLAVSVIIGIAIVIL